MMLNQQVPEYEDLATKYNLLARREAKRRSPTTAGSASAAGAAVSTDALAELMRRQNEILLDIRAELSALRERTGAGTPPVEDSDTYEDDYGFDLARFLLDYGLVYMGFDGLTGNNRVVRVHSVCI
ncbi:hypothetical protein Trihar35433_9542 [Trichoderma harzianum]|nr:hypothetical protein Trihar35433_9542 [Trichoderma harzianum]